MTEGLKAKVMKINSRKKELLLLAAVLIIQSVIFVFAGFGKNYIHMDEAYSMALSAYDKVEIEDNEDFYGNWHEGSYYMDYLVLDEDEVGDYSPVYNNQRDDVHPPLYYLLLRLSMNFSVGNFSVWPGIAVNIIIYAFVTVMTYLILRKLYADRERGRERALILTFFCSVSLSAITAVVYLRMYALSTLWVLLTVYLHILLTERGFSGKLLVPIALVALLGSLTHYYYLFFLAATYLTVTAGYIIKKNYKHAILYTSAMIVAAAASLGIFPYSIEHMFFGYRGEGAMQNMKNGAGYFGNLGQYLVLAGNSINHLFIPLAVIAIIAVCILLYKRFYMGVKDEEDEGARPRTLLVMWLPTVFYFLLVSVASPWHALRYIMPVCPLIFILVTYAALWSVKRITDEKWERRLLALILAFMVAVPVLFGARPQELFPERADIVEKLSGEYNLPAVYFLNSDSNRFLDDILLFALLDESYVAEDVITYNDAVDEATVAKIFEGKDTSEGVIIFINEWQWPPAILDTVMHTLGLSSWVRLAELNAGAVYYVN